VLALSSDERREGRDRDCRYELHAWIGVILVRLCVRIIRQGSLLDPSRTAMLVLLPESWAAIRAALVNRLQTSINLALGSAATIGLTIPVVALAAAVFKLPLVP